MSGAAAVAPVRSSELGETRHALDRVLEHLEAARALVVKAGGWGYLTPPPLSEELSAELEDLLVDVDAVTAGVVLAREEV